MLRTALLLVLAIAGPVWAAESGSSEDRVLRMVGVLAHRGDAAARRRWQPTLDAVGEAMPGHRFEVIPLSLDGVRAALTRGEIDYLFTNPGHLYRLEERFRLSPMAALRTDRDGNTMTGNRFGAVLFVRADDSSVTTLADLKNRKLAAVAPDAFGGFEIAAATLMRNGLNPWRDLDSIAFLGFPQDRVIEAVLEGAADAGTVRTGMLEAAVHAGKFEAHEVRILNALRVPGFDYALSTELVPEWILSSTSRISEPERRQFTIALLNLESDHPAVHAGNYGGWTTVPADAAIRQLLETVDTAKSDSQSSVFAANLVIGLGGLLCLAIAGAIFVRSRRVGMPFPDAPDSEGEHVHLTPREKEILGLVGNGLTTKEIARDLGISPKTVEFHRGHLMRKFGAHNMAELVHKAGSSMAIQTG